MVRPQRLFLPAHPHHVVQRGHNHGPIFLDDEDRRQYLHHLAEVARESRVAVHAYALGEDRVHLLLTPQTAEAISRMMQALGRRYVAAFNRRYGRSGTLWAGRFASHLVDEASVLDCQCYLESIVAPIGSEAESVVWTSAAHHLGSRHDPLVTPHRVVWALGNTPFEREAAYRARLGQGVSPATRQAIEQAMRSGLLLGDESARHALERELHRSLAPRPRGRPAGSKVKPRIDSGTN
ncbi:transposase [Ideonella sp. B508-1]|uniref:transposase n=1 Tax=Ideonella sp. B508-1 TaxID=137716 RepID=UPI00034C1437|nr:transposase [Ideonella sp. B508-1]